MNPASPSWTHVLAIVKGAVEGDSTKHFGSLLAYHEHAGAASALGLVTILKDPDRRDDVAITDAGTKFYSLFDLDELPAGRANQWPVRAAPIVDAAEFELESRWQECE